MTHWLKQVEDEQIRQSSAWNDDIPPEVWAAVLAEETGEVAQAILNGDLQHAQLEIVQVAAICARMHASLDRRLNDDWMPGWQTKPCTG
jgi:NTP pyrophosphatase (non-canonical NTP hydrolase)